MNNDPEKLYDVIVIGGGQSALATAYYLRRTNLRYLLLDKEPIPGGSWPHNWDSLHLFSPAQWSSLPGVIMPGGPDYYPTRDEAISYLQKYEARYSFPVVRPVTVQGVTKQNDVFALTTTNGTYFAKAVVSATGSFTNPYIPGIRGRDVFKGQVLHSSQYQQPQPFRGKRTAVVGEGNSGAQILADLAMVTDTLWITREQPSFLPDDVDGRYLFDAATQLYEAKKQGREPDQKPPLGQIVMVPAVKAARERGVYQALPAFDYFYADGIGWKKGQEEPVDAVIFCTGFRPALEHLRPLGLIQPDGEISTKITKALAIDGLWLVGYGGWTGFASATLIAVGRTAKRTVEEITAFLQAG